MEHFCEFYVEAKEPTTVVPHLKQCSRMYVTKLLFQVLECVWYRHGLPVDLWHMSMFEVLMALKSLSHTLSEQTMSVEPEDAGAEKNTDAADQLHPGIEVMHKAYWRF